MAVAAYKLSVEDGLEQGSDALVERLEIARSRIEERFLAGGAAILSILDALTKLVGSLDQLTSSLDAEAAEQTMAELEASVAHLSQLIDLEAGRQDGFRLILTTQHTMRPQIANMQETLRYLRTFALTAKITGAGIPDFAGFAEEILRRIQDGTRQVDELSAELGQLGKGLGPVIERGETILDAYRAAIPNIVSDLSNGVARITDHRRQLMGHAAAVKTVAGRIQAKLASLLSAMQIGDMTRQRIEHCQSSFVILEELLASDVAVSLTPLEREALARTVRELVAMQLDQTIEEFTRDTNSILATVSSFDSDLMEIGSVRLLIKGESGTGNAMQELETGIGSARDAVQQIEKVAQEAAAMGRSTASTVDELVAGIGIVKVVRTDIHYMALNTNLRCSRLGEEGKAINVVTAELRNFAAQLDETSGKVLTALGELEAAALSLGGPNEACEDISLDERLERALSRIREAGDKMESGFDGLSTQSEFAEGEMSKSLARLNFDTDLGDVLRQCADGLALDRRHTSSAPEGAATQLLGQRILKLYTMASERELHARMFGSSFQGTEEPGGPSVDEDDVFDALF